jgi:hypothetical protein
MAAPAGQGGLDAIPIGFVVEIDIEIEADGGPPPPDDRGTTT